MAEPESVPSNPTITPEAKPTPPIPSVSNDADATQTESDDAEDEPVGPTDPYSNLDGAFGNYLADQPRPMASVNHRTRNGDEEDLLF